MIWSDGLAILEGEHEADIGTIGYAKTEEDAKWIAEWMQPRPDFANFWAQVVVGFYLQRLALIQAVAEDEAFAARLFKAFSATARLRTVLRLCTAKVVEVE